MQALLRRIARAGGRSCGHPGVKRALIIVCVFFVFQQITGINVPFYYGPRVMSDFFKGPASDAVSAAIAGVEVTAILGAVNVVATYFGFRWIDKMGRRPLALGGFAGMMVFILVAALGVAYMTGVPKTVVVMVGFSFFITSFAIGVGGTGWLIQGEYFPTDVRGRAAAIAAGVDWLANFAIIEAFPTLQPALRPRLGDGGVRGAGAAGHPVRRALPARDQRTVAREGGRPVRASRPAEDIARLTGRRRATADRYSRGEWPG